MPSPPYEIVNVVLTAQLSVTSIDIDEIAANFDGRIIQRPLSVHVRYMSASLAFSPWGGVIVTGVRSVHRAKSILRGFLADVRQSGAVGEVRIRRTSIANLVASADLGRRVGLDVLAASIEGCAYDPTHASALTFRVPGSSAVCQVHGTGRVIVLGAKSEEQIQRALEALTARLKEHDGGCGDD